VSRRIPTALSIAGSDPSGGAGIQADLKAFQDGGVYGMAVITALTVQDTTGVHGWAGVAPDFVRRQIRSVLDDIPPDAIKIGMVGTAEIAAAIADGIADYRGPVVLDPVMISTSGHSLLDADAQAVLVERLVPRAALLTPNLPEARRLFRERDPARWAQEHGVAVLRKDGHGTASVVEDELFTPDGARRSWTHPRLTTRNTHGTGCTLSSRIAAALARGLAIEDAVAEGITYLSGLIARSTTGALGRGASGPLLHGPVGLL
jgi:hydroxymethylpyrimidine/phosphomethylpyrimidine kinase